MVTGCKYVVSVKPLIRNKKFGLKIKCSEKLNLKLFRISLKPIFH